MKWRKKIFLLPLLIAAFFAAHDYKYSERGKMAEISAVSAEASVGQNFIVGINSTRLSEDTVEFLTRVKPGGIILYKQANIESEAQLTSFISELQELASETTGKPYFIFLDEEPGGATRLDLFKGFSPKAIDWKSIERDVERLKKIGINVELAPIADYVEEDGLYMSRRSSFRNEHDLVSFNDKFIRLLDAYSISATLKHFPGLGSLGGDPHKNLQSIEQSTSTLHRSLSVFKKGIDSGAGFVMTNHSIFSNIDPENSVTFSKKAIDILRDDLQFKGIIITDDISGMPFTYKGYDFASKALLSGHTMVMLAWRRETMESAWENILKEYKNGGEIRRVIDANYELVSEYKDLYLKTER